MPHKVTVLLLAGRAPTSPWSQQGGSRHARLAARWPGTLHQAAPQRLDRTWSLAAQGAVLERAHSQKDRLLALLVSQGAHSLAPGSHPQVPPRHAARQSRKLDHQAAGQLPQQRPGLPACTEPSVLTLCCTGGRPVECN